MRYFITGATGFIGQVLCRTLAERGDTIVALVRSPDKLASLPAGTEVVEGDLSIFSDDATVLPECDVVVHLAGIVTAPRPELYQQINRDAVANLITCLKRQSWSPARFLFASSLAAAGPSPANRPWTEADPLRPVDLYGEAKAAAEELVADSPFPTTCFRPPIVLGAGDAATLTLYRAAHYGVGIRVGHVAQRLSYVDVRDAVAGIVHMATDTRDGDYTYYLSHPETVDTDALWRALGNALNRRVVVIPLPRWVLRSAMRAATFGAKWSGIRNQLDEKQYQQLVAPAFVCSSEALRRDLGWRPRFTLEQSLRDAAGGYRQAGFLP